MGKSKKKFIDKPVKSNIGLGTGKVVKNSSKKKASKKVIKQTRQKHDVDVTIKRKGSTSEHNNEDNSTEMSKKKKRKMEKGMSLRERMLHRLQGARFRFLNEQMYTSEGKESKQLFKKDPQSFQAYHEGFQQQVTQWKINPLDLIVKNLKRKQKSHRLVVADFGCGDAKLASSLPSSTVHSFDLVALNERVTACDMAHTPLEDSSVDIAVFCLSLMGTNLADYLAEANRVLKKGGLLKIAEVESRFEDVNHFISALRSLGFKNTSKNLSESYFYFLDFKKESDIKKNKKIPVINLKPCMYKKR